MINPYLLGNITNISRLFYFDVSISSFSILFLYLLISEWKYHHFSYSLISYLSSISDRNQMITREQFILCYLMKIADCQSNAHQCNNYLLNID